MQKIRMSLVLLIFSCSFLLLNLVVTAKPSFSLQKGTLQKPTKLQSTSVHKTSDILTVETLFRNFNKAIFLSKDIKLAFRNYYNFKPLNKDEKAFLVEQSVGSTDIMETYSKELQVKWCESAWRDGYGNLYFALGLPSVDLTDENDNLAIHYPILKYDDCLSEALKESQVSKEQFQTSVESIGRSKANSLSQLTASLLLTEKVYRNLDKVILREIDKKIYARNVAAALDSISAAKVRFKGKAYYYCFMKPYFECYITNINGKLKIISLSDNN